MARPDESKLKSLQATVSSADSAAMASYTLIGAIVLLGGAGYGLDRWLGTTPWLLLGGLLLGLVVGFYELAKAVFWRQ
jgi:F0F1-type ATP synthase assembly protein I